MEDVVLDPRVGEVLRRYWGFDQLRPLQGEAIQASLEGRDAVVVLPTGGGKSLCYQVPPVILGRPTVVVSPLIALIKDQVDGLQLSGYPAAGMHSGMTPDALRDTEQALLDGEIQLLFVSPERLLTSRCLGLLDRAKIRCLAVDESHCISEWGHDFRPEYRRIAEVRQRLGDICIQAFTATATERVRHDIVTQLGLHDPTVLVGSFDRPNLRYRIRQRYAPTDQIAAAVSEHAGEASIVYCLSRKDTESVAESLQSRGIDAAAYHAGMTADQRTRVQEAFSQERTDVVVATVAFGMGIDRSNVRCVVHATMPKNVEAYQQETGRAGRDGLDADCILLYSNSDWARWQELMKRSAADAEGEGDGTTDALDRQLQLLREMQRLCTSVTCRHRLLSEYFGQTYDRENCGACDVCLGEIEMVSDPGTVAQKILSCVARVDQRFGSGHVIDVLRGRDTERVTRLRHHELSTFGLMRDVPKVALASYIDQLIDQEFLVRTGGEYPTLGLGPHGREGLRAERDVQLLSPRVGTKTKQRSSGGRADDWEGVDRELFEDLRSLRTQLARDRGVPPYVVFSDATLRALARDKPSDTTEMLSIRGIGQSKLEQFGALFLDRIRDHEASASADG